MLKSLIISASLLFAVSTAYGYTPTPLTPDCSKTAEYEKTLTDNGFVPMFVMIDKLNPNVKEEFLYATKNHSVVVLSQNDKTNQFCLMIYGQNESVTADPDTFRDFLDDSMLHDQQGETP